MRRRDFVTLIGVVAGTWPVAARAQQPDAAHKVAFLFPGPDPAASTRLASFMEGLRSTGYRQSDELEIIFRPASRGTADLDALAAEIAGRRPDVVAAVSPAAVRAMRAAAPTVPIVAHDLESDPIANGWVSSIAHPGGTITGYFFDFPTFSTKFLELMKETVPGLVHAVVLWDPATGAPQTKAIEDAAAALGVKLDIIEVGSVAEADSAFAAARRLSDVMLLLSSPLFGTNPRRFAELTLQHKFAAVTLFPDFARSGGLMAYGPNVPDSFRRVGVMAGKVLHGTRPGDLPVERPVKFELVVNLKTAKALNLTFPTSMLLRADEVIE